MRTTCVGWPASSSRTWPPTGSSTARRAGLPSSTSRAGSLRRRRWKRSATGSPRGWPRLPQPVTRSWSVSWSPRCATTDPSREIATLAIDYRDHGVAGFDIAGAEAGYPPTRYLDAFDYLKRNNAFFTIHAGEAFGLPSIWEAVQICGANRLGHGVRIIDDITLGPDGKPKLGDLAAYIRDQRIPLEMCPSSNVHTGAAASIAEHPIGLLRQLRFRVTVNSDNQLMSRTNLSREFALLCDAFDYTLDDVRWFTINAAKSAFYPFDVRLRLIEDVIKPGFAALGATG